MIYLVTNQTSIESPFELATIAECYEYCNKQTALGLDIETTRKYNKWMDFEGLDPHTSDIVMLQIGTIEVQYIIDTRCVDISILLPILEDKNVTIVGHNLKFEYKHILSKYGIRINNLYDTMIAEKILTNGLTLNYGLKDLIEKYFNKVVDKTIRLGFLTIRDRPFTVDEIYYGAEDIELPLKIRDIQLKLAEEQDLMNCFRLEFRFTCAMAEMEFTGINFNPEKWLTTYNENLEVYQKLIKELDDYILENYSDTKFVNRQLDLFNPGYTCAIQWSSSKQVIAFFKYLRCCPQAKSKTTKKMEFTVEAKEVESLLIKSELNETIKNFIKLYLRTKEYEQAVTTFGKSFLKHVNPITKRIHSNYNQIINTGRMSSSSPNNQNIPAKHGFRYAFDASSGKVIVNADYSGQENIVLANKALDPDILSFYDRGLGDMHSFIASKLFPDKLTFEELKETLEKKDAKLTLNARDKELLNYRQIAKAAGFALAYGGNGHTIAKNLGLPNEVGEKVYVDYFKAFPGLNDFFERTKAESFKNGYILIDTVTKRKFYYKDMKYVNRLLRTGEYRAAEQLQDKMGRLAQNYPIQGESGSITKYAAILLYDWILENNYQDDIKLVLMVHDELNLEAPLEYADLAAKQLERCMEESGKVWCKRVPLKATACISEYWQH